MSLKKITLLMCTLIITVGTSSVYAQDKETAAVETAVKTLIEGMLHPSKIKLENISSEKLTYGHSSGKVENQEEFVNTLVSGASVFEDIEIKEQSVDILDNTALVRHTLLARTNDPGKGQAKIKLGISLTWVKIEGKWILFGRQAFKLPE